MIDQEAPPAIEVKLMRIGKWRYLSTFGAKK